MGVPRVPIWRAVARAPDTLPAHRMSSKPDEHSFVKRNFDSCIDLKVLRFCPVLLRTSEVEHLSSGELPVHTLCPFEFFFCLLIHGSCLCIMGIDPMFYIYEHIDVFFPSRTVTCLNFVDTGSWKLIKPLEMAVR